MTEIEKEIMLTNHKIKEHEKNVKAFLKRCEILNKSGKAYMFIGLAFYLITVILVLYIRR